MLLFDWDSAAQDTKLQSTMKGVFSAIEFHSQGLLIAAGAGQTQGEIVCWSPGQAESSATITTAGPCLAMDLHPDGRRVAVAQSIGKRTYPEAGALGIYDLPES